MFRAIPIAASLLPSILAAQTAPRLDPVAVPAALEQLDFALQREPPIVVHSSGCVVLFDVDKGQLACIDPTSGATRRFGRRGAGPGEFEAGHTLVSTPDGGLLVFDHDNMRLTTVTRDWKLGPIVPVSQKLTIVAPPGGDTVLALGGSRGFDLLAVSLHDGRTTLRFAPSRGDSSGLFQGAHEYEYGFWLRPRLGGGWFVVPPWRYRILIEDERGVKRASFGRDLPPELPSKREIEAFRATLLKANPSLKAGIDRLTAEWAKTPKPSIAHAPAVDARGRLWVISGRIRADSTELDAFDTGGHFLGTRRLRGDVTALGIRGDDMYAVTEYLSGNNEGTQGVLHYRIR